MSSRQIKTCVFRTFAALALAGCVTALSGASTGRAAGNGFKAPTLADRTLVPKAVRLVIGFKPTVTT